MIPFCRSFSLMSVSVKLLSKNLYRLLAILKMYYALNGSGKVYNYSGVG